MYSKREMRKNKKMDKNEKKFIIYEYQLLD